MAPIKEKLKAEKQNWKLFRINYDDIHGQRLVAEEVELQMKSFGKDYPFVCRVKASIGGVDHLVDIDVEDLCTKVGLFNYSDAEDLSTVTPR